MTATLGAGCLAVPGPLLVLFGADPAPAAQIFMRAFGASLLFVAFVHHATRSTREARLVRAVAFANLVEDGILCILSIAGVAAGTFSTMGLVLACAFGGEVLLNAWLYRRFSAPDP